MFSGEHGIRRALQILERGMAAGSALRMYGTALSLGPALAAHLTGPGRGPGTNRGPLLYVVASEERAEAALGDLGFFLGPTSGDDHLAPAAMELPAPESSPYAEVQADRRNTMRRMAMLFRLSQGLGPRVLVVSAAALSRRVVPRAGFDHLSDVVTVRATIDRDTLIATLRAAGYGRAQVVEDPGTFAVRGSVIDLYPPVYRHPIRLELFGDEVESIRLFDGATQRTLRDLDSVRIHPVRETVRTAGATPREKLLAAADAAAYPSSKTRLLVDQIEAGEEFFGIEALAPVFHAGLVPLLDYLPDAGTLVVEDPEAVLAEARRSFSRLRETAARRRDEHRLALDPGEFFLSEEETRALLHARARLELSPVEIREEGGTAAAIETIEVRATGHTGLRAELVERRGREESGDLGRPLKEKINAWLAEGYRVRLVAPNRTHAERLVGLLKGLGLTPGVLPTARAIQTSLADLLDGAGDRLGVLWGPLGRGFRLPEDRLVLVAEEEIFGTRAHREATIAHAASLGDLGDVVPGDPVVHDEHGVGRYRGLKKLDVRGVPQDFLHLEYDGGSVYVPVYRIGLVRRFVGGGTDTIRLDKLGGKTWVEKKRRVSAEARKVAEELLQLYAQRKALPGHSFPAPDVVFQEFEETFPFEETPDQAKAITAVLEDMQADSPMDRLICGDVGYGKTEVALRATLLAVLGGKQVAVLAPTTVLAEQHFGTFSERFADFPVRVGSLSRFRDRSEQQQTVAALAAGKLDVVIGTHRLLSRDVRFQNLGLLVIDEEQRFGVTHKERLKEMRSQVDVLTLTATPIPRTLQMSMAGLREISIIATPPADRLAIRTFLCRWDSDLLGEALNKELARGGQIFFVHNRIEDLPKWVEKVRSLAPTARVAMGHGQMGEGELEKVMIDFVDGRFDVLCCTTIIESGIDISRANTMIVNEADRYGLAQLYQLRGRIGRSRQRAFCYLVVPAEGTLSSDAKQRLAVLQRFTELGAGFQVSTHDLEIRGAGDLLGERQSGALAAVGFEQYARILEDAVAELRGQPIRHELDPEINVDLPAFLPDDYIPDTGQRLDLYRRFAQAQNEDEVREVVAELHDRYGEPPEEALLLSEVMIDKTLVRRIGARAYDLTGSRMTLAVGTDTPLQPAKVMNLVQAKNSRWKLSPDMRLSYQFDDREKKDRLASTRQRLGEVLACLS